MSQAQDHFPIPVLDALGQEFERIAAAPRPVRSRLPLVAPWKIALPAVIAIVAIFIIATPPGQSVARHIGNLFGLTQEERILAPVCGTEPPCVMVPTHTDEGGGVVAPGTNLLEEAVPASECPEALAAYEARGEHVDAFLGGCPDPSEFP